MSNPSNQKSNKIQNLQVNNELKLFNLSIYRSVALIHWIGYGLLIFGFLDIFFLLISPSWVTPGWFLLVLEQCVAFVPVLLIGFGLAFFGELKPRILWEVFVLRWLSWLALILSVIFLILIPLGIYSTIQLLDQNEQAVAQKGQYNLVRLETFQKKLSESKSLTDLRILAQVLEIEGVQDSNLKQEINQKIVSQKIALKLDTQSKIISTYFRHLKKFFKLTIGAILASLAHFLLWKNTLWARQSENI
jgi:hypothetical protein